MRMIAIGLALLLLLSGIEPIEPTWEALENSIREFSERTGCAPYRLMPDPMSPRQFVAFTCPNSEIKIAGFYPMPSGRWVFVEAVFPLPVEPENI